MKALLAPIRELGGYDEMQTILKKPGKTLALSGCVDSPKLHLIYGLANAEIKGSGFSHRVIVTYSDQRMREIYDEYRFYDRNVSVFPAKDLIFYQADIHGNLLTQERIKCFKQILEDETHTVVTTFAALMTPVLPLDYLVENILTIKKNMPLCSHRLAADLVKLGYEHTHQVENGGQFAIRGGIIDIFDLTAENPWRIELWGDDVETIRHFDSLSQRSSDEIDSITVYPATEMILSPLQLSEGMKRIEAEAKQQAAILRKQFLTAEAHRLVTQVKELREQLFELKTAVNLDGYVNYFYDHTASFLDLFATDTSIFFLDEPARIREHASAVEKEFRESMGHRLEKGYILPRQAKLLFGVDEISARLERRRVTTLSTLAMKKTLIKPNHKIELTIKAIPSYNKSFEALVKDLTQLQKNMYRILLLSGSRTRAARLALDLQERGLTAFFSEDEEREINPGEIMTRYGRVMRGFEYPLLKYAVIAESDIYGIEKKKRKRKRYEGRRINDFNELKVGDYVVHENHGLGVYRGIERIEVEKIAKDYMKIEYRDGGVLYVVATGFHVIQKYASADARKPRLNNLGSPEWTRTKAKVKEAVDEIARELVMLYAARQEKSGYEYEKDTIWQQEFEELFPFEETHDQLQAIDDTKRDMENRRIMDRLICGDVGYGKTEIAIRAAFKAVQEDKQVVYLVPTTILAQQHYNTFIQRMKDFPVRIDLLSRFRTPSEQKKTLSDLRKGQVDIVIGTHRVLSKDVAYRDLGLLVIDEEQRFGVKHKEKIKQMKDNVDVLTLTATPIPRTLHMSLIGIRDMSVLEEAPHERVPIQTFVCEYDEEMVREAIVRELSREGQVYYVYNRIANIVDITAQIQKMIPEAVVHFAHGQMPERELERIMYDFVNGEIDVLVSTTIIETGLDIANVNTMIIHDSDHMGLAQLYQLRGRVGRSNRTAYAFLMYKRDKMLKEVAEKRLAAIKEFTELGSGFKIAMRDLEIRGAGNLLGQKQHGHMEAVGYDLYCKMLDEAVRLIKGESTTEDIDAVIDFDVDAFIPPSFILNEMQKLSVYKRIAGIESKEDCGEIRDELRDRFGEIPVSVENLLRVALIRVEATALFITEIKEKNGQIFFYLRTDAPFRVENIPAFLHRNKDVRFNHRNIPFFACRFHRSGLAERDSASLLALAEEIMAHIREMLL
ncbi:MAG: transcription-repair coupling factor [Lachnospiraceae bacterium]|jgi:transcription-repair coupling factor (superfamily II helicase)|nr:transcription-repair coupling factor [Lachnospiraceae bacterium]